jgi:hypothetical protein
MSNSRFRSARVAIALVATLVMPRTGAPQVGASELTAAFLYNFARFTEWPIDVVPATAPLVLCVINDTEVARFLSRAVQGKTINGRRLTVRKAGADDPLGDCQLLYVSGLEANRARRVLDAVKGASVLTVSDLAEFAAMGGTAKLFMDGERMRFAVNVDAALRANVRISAQLLNLAQIVRDDHDFSN